MCTLHHENSAELKGSQRIREYILGGNGIVTLLSPSRKWRTYRFELPRMKSKYPNGTLFVYVKMKHDHWAYVGMLSDSHQSFRSTRGSRFSWTSPEYKGALYLTHMMYKDFETPMKVFHEGVCGVCGRPLTRPKSIESGIGPICRKKLLNV